jgi:hypothetical protein
MAIAAKEKRHPRLVTKIASGAEAAIAPKFPIDTRTPVRLAKLLTLYHDAIRLVVHRKATETPSPMKVLPSIANGSDGEMENIRVPSDARKQNDARVFLGPNESTSNPAGICMAA